MRHPRRIVRTAAIAIAVALHPGCVAHVARVRADPAAPGGAAIGGRTSAIAPATTLDAAPLPISEDVSAWRWRRTPEGGRVLQRCETRCATPLPWWQRFPADAASDLDPREHRAAASVDIVYADVPARTPADLLAEARRDGFAPSTPATEHP